MGAGRAGKGGLKKWEARGFVACAAMAIAVGCGSRSGSPAQGSAGDAGSVDAEAEASTPGSVPWCVYPSLPGDPPATVAGFASALEDALCTRLVRCAAIPADGVPACVSDLGGSAHTFATLASEAAAGRVALDPVGAKACLDAIAQATCDKAGTYCFAGVSYEEAAVDDIAIFDAANASVMWGGPACAHALVGLVPTGGECMLDASCAGGVCADENTAGVNTCTPLLPDGAPCSPPNSAPCVSGACIYDADASAPPFGECTPRLPLGATCSFPTPACSGLSRASCARCDDGLYCAPGGTCEATGAEGASCTGRLYELDCQPGLYCGPTATCSQRLPAGSPCTAAFACQDGLFCVGLVLSQDPSQDDGPVTVATPGTCSPPAALGGSCRPLTWAGPLNPVGTEGCTPFAAGCSPGTSTCVADPGTGAVCTMNGPPPCDPLANEVCGCPSSGSGLCDAPTCM